LTEALTYRWWLQTTNWWPQTARVDSSNKAGYNKAAMIPQDLLDMLVCPVCKEPVVLKNGTGLKCGKCRRVYPIQDDIPIMLVDSATIDPN